MPIKFFDWEFLSLIEKGGKLFSFSPKKQGGDYFLSEGKKDFPHFLVFIY
jgi:hypothetical protein